MESSPKLPGPKSRVSSWISSGDTVSMQLSTSSFRMFSNEAISIIKCQTSLIGETFSETSCNLFKLHFHARKICDNSLMDYSFASSSRAKLRGFEVWRLDRLILWIIVFASPLYSEEEASGIIRKMVQRDLELSKNREQLVCEVHEKKEDLDTDGKVTSTEWIKWSPLPTSPNRYGVEDAHRLSNGKLEVSKEEPFSILQVMDHFTCIRAADEVVDNTLCYQIKFSPKDRQKYKTREEKVANQLQGVLWISQADYSLVKNTGRLTRSVDVAWFFASVEEVEFSFESQVLPNGELGPKTIEYRFLAEIPPFLTFHERHTRFSIYKPTTDSVTCGPLTPSSDHAK